MWQITYFAHSRILSAVCGAERKAFCCTVVGVAPTEKYLSTRPHAIWHMCNTLFFFSFFRKHVFHPPKLDVGVSWVVRRGGGGGGGGGGIGNFFSGE